MGEKSLVTMSNRFDELFLPTTKDDLFKLSKMYADSNLVPDCYKRKSADIVIAWSLGMPLGLSMMQCLLGIAVINGRPTLWGDVLNGLILSQHDLESFDEEWDNESQTWTCTIKRRGRKPITRTFSMDEAKVAKLYPAKETAAWTKYPKRMIQMRARAFCIRDSYSDVTSGLAIEPGEIIDITDSAKITKDNPKTAISDKIATAANAKKEDNPAPVSENKPGDTAPPTPPRESKKYKDIGEVVEAFRSAANVETLKGMIGLVHEVEPGFKDEAGKEYDRQFSLLKQETPKEDAEPDYIKLRGELQSIAVGLNATMKSEISEQLFGDASKKLKVKDLGESELVQLQAIFEGRGLIEKD